MATKDTTFTELADMRPNAYMQQRILDVLNRHLNTDLTQFLTKKQQKKVDKWIRKIRKYDPNYAYTKSIIGQHTTSPKTMKVVRYNRLSLPTDESTPHANL
jgi:hypothetical protein